MRITLFKLRAGIAADETALREGHGYRTIPTKDMSGLSTRLFVRPVPPFESKWVAQLRTLTDDPLDALNQQSSAAVLMVEHNGSSYALTFGSGYHALNPARIERGFGLRVAVNALSAGKVKSVDVRGLNSDGRSAKVIAPTASALEALGVEPAEEWVRQIGGPGCEGLCDLCSRVGLASLERS